MNDIASKWYLIAQNKLEPGDEIQKSFPGEFDGKNGYLVISNKKLIFVHEEGFWQKKYDIILNLPIENVGKISHEDKYMFGLIESDGKKHIMKTRELSASIVERSIEESMK